MTSTPDGRHEAPQSLFGWGDPPGWAVHLTQMIQQVLNNQQKILKSLGEEMSLTTDLQDQIAAIQSTADEIVAEDGNVFAAIKDLASKAQGGSVSDADVQAVLAVANDANTKLQAELAKMHSTVQAADPSVEPPPAA